ncbi:MAG: hypothetical protein NVSMB55_06830 [Mycobacteriales bacterium]
MAVPPSSRAQPHPALLTAAGARDEVAEQRVRHGTPHQRQPGELSEPDREDYELRLDAYEEQLAVYRTRLENYASQLEAAHHDGLTGTWLRQAGRQLLDEELQRATRSGRPLTIAFVDVDGLKLRNDRLGHAAGDRALVLVARALIGGLRGYDHVVRWGGDEFLCILPDLSEQEAVGRVDEVRHQLAGRAERIAISTGLAQRRPDESAVDLVHRADQALYASRGLRLVD